MWSVVVQAQCTKSQQHTSIIIICSNTVLLGKTSSDSDEYICHTCSKYIHQNKIPHHKKLSLRKWLLFSDSFKKLEKIKEKKQQILM